MSNVNGSLGSRISDLLEQQGLSQRELADKVGVTEVSMSRYIKGDRTPKGPIISNIARVLHTTSDYLLGHEVEAEDPELVYYRTQRAIARNAKKWSKKQKADLVNVLFDVEDEDIKEFCRRLKDIPAGPLIEEAHPRVTRLSLDQDIRETAYVLECIATLKSIQELGDCNTCGVKDCQYRPDWGKPVRYNCPHYEAGNEAE